MNTAAVETAKIKDLAVTEAKIATGAVTYTKIANSAVINTKIAPGSVTEEKMSHGAVTGGKIGSGAVTESKIGSGAVTEDKIGAKAVTGEKLADDAVVRTFAGAAIKENVNSINVDNLGDVRAKSIDMDELPKVCGFPMYVISETAPNVVPDFVSQHWIDTVAKKVYIAVGVSSSADFVVLN